MKVLQIHGGRPLRGEVSVPGSKNSALAILSAVVLASGEVALGNVPNVSDTKIKTEILEIFGSKVRWREGTLFIDSTNLQQGETDEEKFRLIRTSFYLLGPLLARLGKVVLPAPGGCNIGARPVDFHLKGLRALGANVELSGGTYIAECDRLKGAEIYLDFPSAGATQHLMSTAVLADGITVIQNAAVEPEVVSLADFLNTMGARIEGAGTGTITIMGVPLLHGANFRVPSDRLQAGTYLLAGAITGGCVRTTGILPDNQMALVNKLREAGAEVEEGPDWVQVAAPNRLTGIKVMTMPYPGFATDMQQPMAAALCLADGPSMVEETIYESRTGHIPELARMGARIESKGNITIIEGVDELVGANVMASDLRAGASLVLAGLAARGQTNVGNVHFIDRGYEEIESVLTSLGAAIERVELTGRKSRGLSTES